MTMDKIEKDAGWMERYMAWIVPVTRPKKTNTQNKQRSIKMPQSRRLETEAEPGDVVQVYIKTKAGTRDYSYEVDEKGLVNWTGSGFLFAKSPDSEAVGVDVCNPHGTETPPVTG